MGATVERELVVYIACSLDGYIAGPGDDLSFLSRVEAPPEDYGYKAFMATVDTVLMGRRTYEKVLGLTPTFWHAESTCFVISRSRTGKDENVTFRNDPVQLVKELKAIPGKRIFCDGGAETVNALRSAGLVDRYIISIIPVMLGSGTALFTTVQTEQVLRLVRTEAFPTGLVQLEYEPLRP